MPAVDPEVPGTSRDPRDNSSPYGVLAFFAWNHDWNNHHYPSIDTVKRDIDLMTVAGVGFVRTDFLWMDLEPRQGQFDFERFDTIVNALRDAHIGILGTLEYNPVWRNGQWNDPPDPALYEAYTRTVVRHFKDRVRYWEIWNEPDHAAYWSPQDELSAYSALLKRIAPVIREEDPTAKVVLGGLAKDWPFNLRRIYKKAGKESFDIVNIHPFVNPLDKNAQNTLRGIYIAVQRVMKEFGDETKPLWATEIGCPGVRAHTDKNSWWMGPSPTEEEQAAWVRSVYTVSLAQPGVQKVFWAFWRDTDHFKDGVDNFGLVDQEAKKKPAFLAYQEMADPR